MAAALSHTVKAREVLGFMSKEELAEVYGELSRSEHPDILIEDIRRGMENCGLYDQTTVTARMRALLVLGFNPGAVVGSH